MYMSPTYPAQKAYIDRTSLSCPHLFHFDFNGGQPVAVARPPRLPTTWRAMMALFAEHTPPCSCGDVFTSEPKARTFTVAALFPFSKDLASSNLGARDGCPSNFFGFGLVFSRLNFGSGGVRSFSIFKPGPPICQYAVQCYVMLMQLQLRKKFASKKPQPPPFFFGK
jgi:hypothetical protein